MEIAGRASLTASRMIAAPLIGALAGFLLNRAHRGDAGWVMAGEMIAGSLLFMVGAAVAQQFNDAADRARRATLRRQAERTEAARLLAEQAWYHQARAQYEALLAPQREDLAAELARSRKNTARLAHALANVIAHVNKGPAAAAPRNEAQARIHALEAAQTELARRQVELDQKTMREAEEVKTRLLALNISDTQRLRNVAEPDAGHSGRLIELETRIRKLAGEIERLSARQPAAAEAGEASKVAPGGTGDGARLGFLKAMLEANQTLRKKIQEAA